MTADPAALPIREDLAEAIESVRRLAIVAEMCHARICAQSGSRSNVLQIYLEGPKS